MDFLSYLRNYFSRSSTSSESTQGEDLSDEDLSNEDSSNEDPSDEASSPSEVAGSSSKEEPGDFLSMVYGYLTGEPSSRDLSNEQPTKYNPLLIGALLILFGASILLIFFTGSDQQPQTESSQTDQQSTQQRQSPDPSSETPGTRMPGEDPSNRFTTNPQGEGSSQKPSAQPQNSGSDFNIQADPSNPEEYIKELNKKAAQRRRQKQDGPPGASGQPNVPSNPYRQSGGGPQSSSQNETLQKAMASDMKMETSPPGDFDPNAEGVPRDPASGRPLGSPPTPAETRKEMEYQQEQQQEQEETSTREELRERYPTGGNLSEEERFLEQQRSRSDGEANVTTVQGSFSPFTIPKGTIIPITLETGASNKLPGVTIMRVTRDVYDRTFRHILIPRGSEIISTYSTASRVGQDRVLVAANRLNLPDGRYVNFSDTRAAGPEGYAGLSDVKDRHLFERFAAAGGLAVLGAVVGASNPLSFLGAAQQDSTGVIAGGGSFRTRFQTSLSQQINQIVGQLLEKQVDRQPTLELRPGLRGLFIANEDIDLRRPYYEAGGDFEQQDAEFRKYKRQSRQRDLRRALRRVKDMMSDQERTRQLRREALNTSQRSRSVPPRQNRQPSAQGKYYVDELKAQGRRGGTFIPPRRGPTAREKYIFGPNYNRSPQPGQSRQGSAPPPSSRPSSRAAIRDQQAPKQIQMYRRKMRSANPELYREPQRPSYNRQRSNNRRTRGKENYRPQPTGNLSSPQGQPPRSQSSPSEPSERSSSPPPGAPARPASRSPRDNAGSSDANGSTTGGGS